MGALHNNAPRDTCPHFNKDCKIELEIREHRVALGCERCFPRYFSFILGVTVRGCRFLVPTTTTVRPLQEYHQSALV